MLNYNHNFYKWSELYNLCSNFLWFVHQHTPTYNSRGWQPRVLPVSRTVSSRRRRTWRPVKDQLEICWLVNLRKYLCSHMYIHICIYIIIWCSLIFYDIPWYCLILFDIIWYFMMLYNIIWYYMILYDIIWYYMMLYDVISCYLIIISCCLTQW